MTDAASQLRHAPREHFCSRINKLLLVLMVIGIAAPLTFRSLPVVKQKADQDAAIAVAETELALGNMERSRLERDVTLLQHDPEYLSILAHDLVNPGYMTPGVTIFQMPSKGKQ